MNMLFAAIAELINQQALVLVVIIAVVGILGFKAGGGVFFWKSSKANIDSLQSDMQSVKADVGSISRDMAVLKERVKWIFTIVSPDSAVKSSSPAHLTKSGNDIVAALGAESVVRQNLDKLRQLVDEKNPQNAYDLQQACLVITENLVDLNILSAEQLEIAKEKSFAYGIPLDNALLVVAVLLRDILIAEKGWTLDDVDKHTP